MKKFLTAAAFVTLSSATALAADLPMKGPMMAPAPVFSWTGFYLGGVGTVGVMSSEHADQWCDMTCSTPVLRSWGGGIGATVGYNWQAGHALYGIEGDISWVDFKNNHNVVFNNGGGENIGAKWDWYSTIRGRMGLVVDDTLAYVTGGAAFVGAKYSSAYYNSVGAFDGGFPSVDNTRVGFAAGAGVEHKFSPNWSLKAEYLYIGLTDVKSSRYVNAQLVGNNPDDVMTHRSDAHLFRLGVNYTFGGGSVVARY